MRTGSRNYVIDAFNTDKPYDQFIHEQVAGDLLPAVGQSRRDELTIATGFLAVGPKGLNETRPKSSNGMLSMTRLMSPHGPSLD